MITQRTRRRSFGKSSHRKASLRRLSSPLVENLERREVLSVAIQSLTPLAGAQEGSQAGGAVAVFAGSSTNVNDYTATVSYGDLTTDVLTAASSGIVDNHDGTYTVTASHLYAEEGTNTLTMTIDNALGGSDTKSVTVTVADAPLYLGYNANINGVPNTPVGAGPIVVAVFMDGNPNAPASDFSATIDWGDGTVDHASAAAGTIVADPNIPGQWDILGNHTYASTGAYQTTVTLQDVGSATSSVAVPTIVANPSPLQVTPYDPATPLSTLTNALLTPGTGLNLVGASFVGQNGQAGTYTGFNFHDQATSVSLTDGVLLTPGSAVNALGPNNSTGATTAYGTIDNPMGDPRLDAMVAPDITFDANSLTLQFTADPSVTSIQFQFVFGSEEYPEWVGQYNDIFAAFLDGQQITFDPAGNPISVNNNFFQLDNSADNTYPSFSAGKTKVAYDIQYDGLTPALTTKATLDPTITTHTLTFAIADTRDQVLDSGVFLTSLSGNGTSGGGRTAPAPQAVAGGPYAVYPGQTVQLDASGTTDVAQDPSTLTYKWDLNGNGIYGETGAAATNGVELGVKPTFVAAGSSVTVSLQVTDSDGVVSTDQAVINVTAPPLTVGSPTPPSATEGQPTGVQTLVTFTDPGAAIGGLAAVVSWGDGLSDTYTAVNGGIVQNADGSFGVLGGHTYAEEASNLVFAVQISDGYGTSSTVSTSLGVSDPAVSLTGGLTINPAPGVAQTGLAVATFVDPGGAEPNTADPSGVHYTADIAWGDGGTSTGAVVFDLTTQVFTVLGDHTYAVAGTYTITIKVHHEAAPDAKATSTARVGAPVAIGQGPKDANTLLINGTPGDDVIRVVPAGDKGGVRVLINGVSQGTFAGSAFASIAIDGQAGNDLIQVDGDVKCAAYLFGGAGNDVLIAGGGPSLLVGGAGNDVLIAGHGPDVLVGGAGVDILYGGDSGDLLIAGSLDLEDQPALASSPKMAGLLGAWTAPSKSYADRVAAVDALLAGHVLDDGRKDVLYGGDGMDHFFLSAGDLLIGKKKGEIAVIV